MGFVCISSEVTQHVHHGLGLVCIRPGLATELELKHEFVSHGGKSRQHQGNAKECDAGYSDKRHARS